MADVGPSKFLLIPDGAAPAPSQAVSPSAWYKAVQDAGTWINADKVARGDILLVAHGYNMSELEVMQRHRRLRDDLAGLGFKGVVVSFDWPSGDKTLAYLQDRHRAKATAHQLVSDGIAQLSRRQTPGCPVNVHLLGHSTGAYVIREAFDDADDAALANNSWNVSQLVFAAGDVSSASMSAGDSGAKSIYLHSVRVTNYSNRHDEALDISNVKRLGLAPRAGRIGLPADAPSTAVNIDCTSYYEQLTAPGSPILAKDQPNGIVGLKSHSWYFGNLTFTRDLFNVLIGTDRTVIPTRAPGMGGGMILRG